MPLHYMCHVRVADLLIAISCTKSPASAAAAGLDAMDLRRGWGGAPPARRLLPVRAATLRAKAAAQKRIEQAQAPLIPYSFPFRGARGGAPRLARARSLARSRAPAHSCAPLGATLALQAPALPLDGGNAARTRRGSGSALRIVARRATCDYQRAAPKSTGPTSANVAAAFASVFAPPRARTPLHQSRASRRFHCAAAAMRAPPLLAPARPPPVDRLRRALRELRAGARASASSRFSSAQ